MSTSLAWDERYQNGGFEFGEAPNLYLQSQAHRLRPGLRALAVGDGEGRNGVWLAGQGLEVTSLDWSGVGLAKAASLARQRGVALNTIPADAAAWDWPRALRELLWSRAIVEECFAGLEVLELLEGTVLLDEGPRHQGHAEVVRALLRKP